MNINTFQNDLFNNEEKHYFTKNDISFAFKLTGPNPEKMLDTSYFTFNINQK